MRLLNKARVVRQNHFNNFRSTFEIARQAGFSITLHCGEWMYIFLGIISIEEDQFTLLRVIIGELPCDEQESSLTDAYDEVKAILDFHPERLGHALLLPPTLQKELLERKIPVESCPTSNVMTLELAKHHAGSLLEGLKTHPQLASWIREHHPFSIGTDDPGVFNTNGTKELLLLQKALDLDFTQIFEIPLKSMDHAFCNVEIRKLVKNRLVERIETLSKGMVRIR